MGMIGDMSRYTQFQVAQSMPIAAANEGGGAAGIGVGLGAGLTMAQQMMNSMHQPPQAGGSAPAGGGLVPGGGPAAGGGPATAAGETKFCMNRGADPLVGSSLAARRVQGVRPTGVLKVS